MAKIIVLATVIAGMGGVWAVRAHASAPETVVRFCYWGNFRDNDFWRQICEDFERDHPGVRIRREWFVGDYGRKLQLLAITNSAADIIMMDDEIFPSYSIRGYLEDLRPYIERESDDLERDLAADLRFILTPEPERDPAYERRFLPTAIESFNYRGFQGGLPWDGNSVIVFFNKDMFDAEGIPYPEEDWTWHDFRDIARRLTRDLTGDGRNDQFGTNLMFDFLGFEPILWSFGGEVLNEEKTRSAMHGPRGVEAAQFVYDMKYVDRSMAWTGEVEGLLTEVQLLTGRIGMVMAGSYMIPTLNQVQDAMRWGLAHMPIGPYGDRYTRVTWDGMSINAHTTPDKKEIAWRFIKYVLSDECQLRIGATQRGFPIRQHLVDASYNNPDTPAREEIAVEATRYGKLTPITPRFLELRDAMAVEFDRLNIAQVTGLTPPEAFARLEHRINDVLAKDMADWARLAGEPVPEAEAPSGVAFLIVAALAGAALLFALLRIPRVRARLRYRVAETAHMLASRAGRIETLEGLLFAAPWLLGLVLFTAFPILFSIVLSFCDWDPYQPISEMRFIGLANYARAFSTHPVSGDPLVPRALYNTFFYAFFAVPLGLGTSLGLALLLNQKVRGITVFRTTFYLPSIISGVATVILWTYIFNPVFGPLNGAIRVANRFFEATGVLAFVSLPEPLWLNSPQWTKPAMIIMSLWGAGGAGMLIFLAGLQGVPTQLYEVADLDGAGRFRKFWNVTLPMLTPTIYFNLIMGIIAALKVFMQAYIMTDGTGGVDKSLLFYVLHLYVKAFIEFEMGYASALAWILFVIILAFTLLIVRSSAVWVYYEGERRR